MDNTTPRALPPYTPFHRLTAETRHHTTPLLTAYDSAIGYGTPRRYHGFSRPEVAADPFYRDSNYESDGVGNWGTVVERFLRHASCASGRPAERGEGGERLSGEEVEGFERAGWRAKVEGWVRWVEGGECFQEVEELRAPEGGAEQSRRLWVHRAVRLLRDKIWACMAPMSTQRWERRKLSSPRYEYEALELLAKTLAVFEYLNDPKVQQVMRVLHNRISEELRGFEAAVNEARLRKGQPQIPLMELWDDYTRALFVAISDRAHGWMIGRINAMRKSQEDHFDRMKAQGPIPDAENTKIFMRLARLIDMERDVDFHFRISRYGFTRASSSGSEQAVPSPQKFKEERSRMRGAADASLSIFAGGITQMRHAMGVGPFPFQLEYFMVLRDQADANKAVRGKDPKKRTKLFGPPPREEKPEPWVQILAAQLKNAENNAEGGTGGFGFVVYRWKEYEGVPWEKVEKAITGDLMNWGEGMVGVGQLKPKAKLQWVEMAGASMENYRMHFQTLRESGQLETGIRHDVFLVIDPHAANAWFPTHLPAEAAHVYAERHRTEGHSGIMIMSSTRSTALGAMPTDFEPWVLAVDPDFGQTNASTATGSSSPPSIYAGWLRMQSSLVFEELYGLAESGILAMEELWKMAASHPCGVYTGVLTEVEIRRFDEWTMLRNRAIKWVLDRPDTMFYGRR